MMDTSTSTMETMATTRAATTRGAIVHERENSRDELEALFNPNKWQGNKVAVPFARRNLPSSFFKPPPTGTKTPNSRNSTSNAGSLNSSACHSRQNSVVDEQQSMRQQQQQHLLLNQKLKNLAQLQQSLNHHSRSSSEPVSMLPACAALNRHQQRLLHHSRTPSELAQQQQQPSSYQNNGGHLSPQTFSRQQQPQPDPSNQFPPGWRAAQTSDGRPYYVNVLTNETSWHLPQQAQMCPQQPQQQYNGQPQPAVSMDEAGDPNKVEHLLEQIPMPHGWEKMATKSGQFYFINHNTKTTCWEDPRMSMLHHSSYIKTAPCSDGSFSMTNYQPQPYNQNYDQLKASLIEIVRKRMDLIKALEDINKHEAYLKNQINVSMADSSIKSSAVIDNSWHPSNNNSTSSSYPSQSMPVLNQTAAVVVNPALGSSNYVQQQQHYVPPPNGGEVNHGGMHHRREQSIELEHVSNMYNKMHIINNSAAANSNATATVYNPAPAIDIHPHLAQNNSAAKQESACPPLLLSPDLDTDSISDDYSLSSSSTTSLLNINL